MEELLPFLQKYEVWIYVFLGIIAFYYLQKLIVAWKEWQGTVFGLERENGQRRFTTSLTILVLLVVFVLMEFVIVSFVAPSFPQVASLPTPTLDLLATPTVTLQAVVDGLSALTTPESTPAASPTPLEEGCVPGQIEWTSPMAGQEISGTIELKGTVNVPNLGFFKYEKLKPGEDMWETMAAVDQPKQDGIFGYWNTSGDVQGDYLLRLVVADNNHNLFPACVVQVRILPQ